MIVHAFVLTGVETITVILLFIDGVGLGDDADYNPWATQPAPNIRSLLSGKPLTGEAMGKHGSHVWLLKTDASLGIDGLPQSATGQAAIFTGRNAPAAMGKHMSGYPFKRLREWVEADNIYLQFKRKGWKATFANSYTEEYLARPATQRGWVSVTTAAIRSLGEPLRYLEDLKAGLAVYHDLTRRTLKRFIPEIEEITPEQAARHMWGIAKDYDLVIHEFFLSDRAGHKHDPDLVSYVVETYDRFLGELVRLRPEHDTVVLVSDHGNSEDLRIPVHTDNPVPTLIIGDVGAVDAQKVPGWDLTCIVPLMHRLVERQKGRGKNGDGG
jgi:2,3-bisphosphoglycerate-independent phosphoglycerate mutase